MTVVLDTNGSTRGSAKCGPARYRIYGLTVGVSMRSVWLIAFVGAALIGGLASPSTTRAAAPETKPDAAKPDAAKPDAAKPDAAKPVDPELDPDALKAHDDVRAALRDLLGGIQTMEQFKTAWAAKGAKFEDTVLTFLKNYPRYKTGNENMLDLAVRLSARLGLDDLSVKILEQIKANNASDLLRRKAEEAILDLSERRAAKALVGKPVAFSFTPLGQGEALDTATLRGKVVVVYFWAAWCDLCGPVTDELKALYEQHNAGGTKKLEVIGVSLDDDRARLEETVRTAKIPWPVQYDGRLWRNEIARKFAVDSIPRVMVIDKSGQLVDLESTARLAEKLPALLAAEK